MTMVSGPNFRRMVLALSADGPSEEAVAAATDIAKVLQTELVGLFLEEENVFQAASLPVATEIVAGVGSRRIDRSRLEQEYRRTAHRMERRIQDAAVRARLACRFDRVRGAAAQALTVSVTVRDLVAVFEPPRPEARAAGDYRDLRRAAVSREGSALLIPRRITSAFGSIAVIADGHPDTAVVSAAAIASGAGTHLDIWITGTGESDELSSAVPPEVVGHVHRLDQLEPREAAHFLARRTRLLVVPSQMAEQDAVASLLGSAIRHGTPVLVLGSDTDG